MHIARAAPVGFDSCRSKYKKWFEEWKGIKTCDQCHGLFLNSHDPSDKLAHVRFIGGFAITVEFALSILGYHPPPILGVEQEHTSWPHHYMVKIAKWSFQVMDDTVFIR